MKLQRLLVRNKVTAWFWGHEHRFAIYKARPDLQYGRLIGHSGVPVWARRKSKMVPESVEYVSTEGFKSGIERFALFGFAVLDFDGPAIGVRYFDEYGNVERSNDPRTKRSSGSARLARTAILSNRCAAPMDCRQHVAGFWRLRKETTAQAVAPGQYAAGGTARRR